jgi:threonylcarbamoyladenosine tRNA methylthiotransferase MtaB
MDSKKFKIVTLGCRTNQYESQAYADQLLAMGFQQAQEGEVAEVCIVNTCTVTESADSSSRHEIRQLSRQHPGAKIVVTGCYAERQPEALLQLEGVTQVIRNKDKEKLVDLVFPDEQAPEFSIKHFEAHTRAFVKVQDGCNSFCTYCIIPYVRGRSKSRTVAEVVQEVETLVANGYKEVVLTGINIGDFDGNPEEDKQTARLSDLVRAVDKVKGIKRLRVSSIDPDEVDDDLADAILNGKHTCPSMHVVLQSGSNAILKRMNRKYTWQVFLATVDRLLQANPDFTFTTDVIVGFPGETDFDFQDTLRIMKEVRFAKVHMFPYSDRPRTRSSLMPNKVPVQMIKERKQELLRISEQMAFELRNRFVGRRMPVLLEQEDSHQKGWWTGHTENFLEVRLFGEYRSNDIVEVELVENTANGLVGNAYTSIR